MLIIRNPGSQTNDAPRIVPVPDPTLEVKGLIRNIFERSVKDTPNFHPRNLGTSKPAEDDVLIYASANSSRIPACVVTSVRPDDAPGHGSILLTPQSKEQQGLQPRDKQPGLRTRAVRWTKY